MADTRILGLDIGGTSSRAMLADSGGRRLGSGTAPGGNPTTHEVPQALAAIEAALRAALHGFDPATVRHAVIGMAGIGRLAEPAVRDQFDQMWRRVGLRCPYQAVADAVVAFAAGTAAADGTLLLAGTGAIAVQFADRRTIRLSDGHGWLLGDLGSGFWLGREAVRASLDHLDGWSASGPLIRQVLSELLGDPEPRPSRDTASAVVNAVRNDQPVALSRFAPAVCQAASAGDPVARDIVARAARHLVDSAERVRAGDDGPLVLAGSLLTGDTALAAEVRRHAAERWPGIPVGVAIDGAAAAAWLAAQQLPDPVGDPDALHARLLPPPERSVLP